MIVVGIFATQNYTPLLFVTGNRGCIWFLQQQFTLEITKHTNANACDDDE